MITDSSLKGRIKWAMNGYQNLAGHVGDDDRITLEKFKDALMLHPKIHSLLVTASNYKPGSKPLDDIMKHINKHLGDTKTVNNSGNED